MRLRINTAAILILISCSFVFAQEPAEMTDAGAKLPQETRLFDEYGPTSNCDLGARIQNVFIEIGQTPNTRAYIIVYRGADALPAYQTPETAGRQIKRIQNEINALRLDASRLEIIDGGYRQKTTIWNEVWIVPEGGRIPQPTETVEKSKTPKGIAFKVDEGSLDNWDARLQKDEEMIEETEPAPEDEAIADIENPETENAEQPSGEVYEDYEPEPAPFGWFSDYFGRALMENASARGVIIFYTDAEVYDLAQSQQMVEDGLRNLAEKSGAQTSNVKIVFGGYRENSTVEYWIVPPGAKEPLPTPAQKVVRENETNN